MRKRLEKKQTVIMIVSAAVIALLTLGIVIALSLGGGATPEREVFAHGDFRYVVLDDGSCEIVEYVGAEEALSIPSAISGKIVSSIADRAFYKSEITSVTLGSFVEKVGAYAFSGCNYLKEVKLNGELKAIGVGAFSDSTGITAIDIPDSVEEIAPYAFLGCVDLAKIELPKDLKIIGAYAFSQCFELSSVSVAEGAAELIIDVGVFRGCSALEEFSDGGVVTKVGSDAFASCSALKTVSFGAKVKEIGSGAFYGCGSLESIQVDSANETFTTDGGALANKKSGNIMKMPPKSTVTEYVAPSFVKSVDYQAFMNCASLKSVTFSEGLESIGAGAFYYELTSSASTTSSLESVVIPKSVKYVGGLAFQGTKYYQHLTDEFVIVGDGVLIKYNPPAVTAEGYVETEYSKIVETQTSIGGTTIKNVEYAVTVPPEVKLISSAFANAGKVNSVHVGSGVKELTDYAFYCATYLEKVSFDEGVAEIGSNAFDSCRLLSEVNIPRSVKKVGSYLFARCDGLKSIVIPASLEKIGNYMFYNCANLSSVVIENGITEIGEGAFAIVAEYDNEGNVTVGVGESKLETIEIPVSVTKIGDYAFTGSGLKEFTFPRGVKEVGMSVLQQATKLEKIDFGSLTEVPEAVCLGAKALKVVNLRSCTKIGADAFGDCSALVTVNVPRSVSSIGSGAFYCCTALTGISLGGVRVIEENAFYGCASLASVSLSSATKTLEDYAFRYCSALKNVNLSSVESLGVGCFEGCAALESANLASIGYYLPASTFSNCKSLTSVKLPDRIEVIEASAFLNCFELKSIALPRNLTVLGDSAFAGCAALTDVRFNDKLQILEDQVFYYCQSLVTLRLPNSVTEIGYRAFSACPALRTVTMGDSVESIGESAFADCPVLDEVILSNNIKTISASAFSNCYALGRMDLPDNVQVIGKNAFSGCIGLGRVIAPRGLVAVGESAFEGCESITIVEYSGTYEDFLGISMGDGNEAFVMAYLAMLGG